jgi:sulfate adenylyltransferase
MVNTPHGGALCNLVAQDSGALNDLKNEAQTLVSFTLNQRQLCDVELILNGGFSPLRGFMNKDDYER